MGVPDVAWLGCWRDVAGLDWATELSLPTDEPEVCESWDDRAWASVSSVGEAVTHVLDLLHVGEVMRSDEESAEE